ncbi:hypothetical protein H9P43_006188 [Blastocladiella emersonii ATCC 22665]|nr:hypothetical protein H9P43_006188 [Blastocladiella emersonii ATCC 22665]
MDPIDTTMSAAADPPRARSTAYSYDAAHIGDRITTVRKPARKSPVFHSPAPSQPDAGSGAGTGPAETVFECNICLDMAGEDPVVTLCGHLYCWGCLDQWFRSCAERRVAVTCPTCKAGCGPDKTIPIFARGRTADPRTRSNAGAATAAATDDTPSSPQSPRPAAFRPEPEAPRRRFWDTSNIQFQAGVFPGLFGFSVNFGGVAGAGAAPQQRRAGTATAAAAADQANDQRSALFFAIGFMILLNVLIGLV